LWDTENGPDRMDEINPRQPRFNSGWQRIMGRRRATAGPGKLVSFGPAAHYEDPQLSWRRRSRRRMRTSWRPRGSAGRYTHDLFVGTVLAAA
jgi:hypothetical protein